MINNKKSCHTGKFWEFTDKIYPVPLANAEIMFELTRDTGHFFSFQSKKFRHDRRFSFGAFSLGVNEENYISSKRIVSLAGFRHLK